MYTRNKSPEQCFEEISVMAYTLVDDLFRKVHYNAYFDITTRAKKLLVMELSTIRKQVIFEIYYILYLLCEEDHHPIYYYCKKQIKQDGGDIEDWTDLAGESSYKKLKYNYEQYRKNQDDLAKIHYKIKNIGLYGRLGKGEIKFRPKLRLLDYLFIKRYSEMNNVNYMLKAIKWNRLTNSNSVSNKDFEDYFIKGIDDLYKEIGATDYAKWSEENNQFFLKSIDYYQLEKNCALELCYNAAYAISNIQKNLKQKKEDIKTLRALRYVFVHEDNAIIQNKAITISRQIMQGYLEESISVTEVHILYTIINNIIYLSEKKLLVNYFGGYFRKPMLSNYWLNIYQNPEIVKEECGLESIQDFMCQETEMFFKNYFGNGQHITLKNWRKVKIKDFRDMYVVE